MYTTTATINPYWDEAARWLILPPELSLESTAYAGDWHSLIRNRVNHEAEAWKHRDAFVRRYAWAISSPEAIAFVAKHLGPDAIEIGGGVLGTGHGSSHSTASISWRSTTHRLTRFPTGIFARAAKQRHKRWLRRGIQCNKAIIRYSLITVTDHCFFVGRHMPRIWQIFACDIIEGVALSLLAKARVAALAMMLSLSAWRQSGTRGPGMILLSGQGYMMKS